MRRERYVPDYENYNYQNEWARRSIEDLAEKQIIRRWLAPSISCLELGGGFGRITLILEPYFQDLIMIDFSKRNLAVCARQLKRTTLIRGDIRHIPFESDSFDCIVAIRVLHHIEHLAEMISEMVRVGKEGATLILGVPNTRLSKYRGISANQSVLIGPRKNRAFVHPLGAYDHPSLELLERRGTGIFDNRIGRRLKPIRAYSIVDAATSDMWWIKPELFMKFRIRKQE